MINPSNDICELNLGELEAVTGAGDTAIGFNEQVAHFLSVHERTAVVDSFEHIPRPTKKK